MEPASPSYGSDEKFDEEKIAFPSFDHPVPTFNMTFGEDMEAPPPAHLPLGARILGPRFFNQSNTLELPTSDSPPRAKGHLARQEAEAANGAETALRGV